FFMRKSQIHSLPHLKAYRAALRKSLTPAEAILWNALKNKQLNGKKFRRQHSIENYIVDFYCAEEKLIIELDGEIHFNTISAMKDDERDKRLFELGFRVLRVE